MPNPSHELAEYLHYAPTPHLAADRKSNCYRTYLDRLGFKSEYDPDATDVRLQFIRDLRSHICVPETMFLRKVDNPAAFEALVQGFLTAYGPIYWGSQARGHLVVSDPEKGFLHPRDSQRVHSRLVNVMEELFNYKAGTARQNDSSRMNHGKPSALSSLELAALDPSEINMLGKAPLGFEAAFTEIDKMRESMDVEPYDSSGGEPDFYNMYGQERRSTQTRNISHTRVTRANSNTGSEHHVSEADSELHLSGSTAVTPPVRASSRRKRKRKTLVADERDEPYEPRRSNRSNAKKRRGLFTSAGVEMRKRRLSRKISRLSPTLTDPAYDYADDAAHHADSGATHNAAHNAAPGAAYDPAHDPAHDAVPKTVSNASPNPPAAPKTEILPLAIATKISLIVIASTQQTLAPVTVSLAEYTSAHSDFNNFFEFLAQECELGDLATDVTAISATYTWNGRKHRLRRGKVEADGRTFVEHVRGAFEGGEGDAGKGEVEMLLHVGS